MPTPLLCPPPPANFPPAPLGRVGDIAVRVGLVWIYGCTGFLLLLFVRPVGPEVEGNACGSLGALPQASIPKMSRKLRTETSKKDVLRAIIRNYLAFRLIFTRACLRGYHQNAHACLFQPLIRLSSPMCKRRSPMFGTNVNILQYLFPTRDRRYVHIPGTYTACINMNTYLELVRGGTPIECTARIYIYMIYIYTWSHNVSGTWCTRTRNLATSYFPNIRIGIRLPGILLYSLYRLEYRYFYTSQTWVQVHTTQLSIATIAYQAVDYLVL